MQVCARAGATTTTTATPVSTPTMTAPRTLTWPPDRTHLVLAGPFPDASGDVHVAVAMAFRTRRCDGWRVRIGIDVGGTKIEGILLGDDGRELARRRERTPTA